MNITKVPIIQIIKNGETIEVNPLTSVNDIGISSGSLKLNTSIVDRELTFGKLISSQFSVQLFNIDDNLEGCGIQLFLEEDGVRTSKFKGTIESSKRDNIGGYRDIIAYDWFYYHRNDDISNWWNNFWVSTRTSATIQEIRISLLTYINMIDIKGYPSNSIYPSNELYPQDVTDSYINDSIVIPNNFNFYTELKLDTILRMICELQAVFPHIDENGNMEFISITNTNTSDLTGLYEGNNSKWEDYTTELITGVGIYSTSNDLSQLIGTTDNVYNISGNLFALTLNAQTLNTLGNNILSAISSIQFTPSKIKMIVSDFDLKLGQRITTPKGYSYVMTNSLSGVCLIEQTIESKSMGSKLSQRVDSRNDTLIEGAKMSKFEQTIDGFTTEVQRIDNVATQASSDASEALQTADGLADDVQTANNNASTALSTANNANTTAITAQSQVTQMADQIVLKVDNNGNVVKVALSSDASAGSNVLIKGDNIQLDGNVNITSGFRLTAGVIQSQNYVAGTSGTKINLSDGILETTNAILRGTVTAYNGIKLYSTYNNYIFKFTDFSWTSGDDWLFKIYAPTGNTIDHGSGERILISYGAQTDVPRFYGSVRDTTFTANRILVSDANKNIVSSSLSTSDLITTSNIGSQSVNYADRAGYLLNAGNNNYPMRFNWVGKGGQPTWLWGGDNWDNMYVYNPSNFNVNLANHLVAYRNDGISTYGTDYYIRSRYNDDGTFMFEVKPNTGETVDTYKISLNNARLYGWTIIGDARTTSNSIALFLAHSNAIYCVNYSNNGYVPILASAFNISSSRLVKENITNMTEDEARKILSLRVVDFDYINGKKNQCGLIAEETLNVAPYCVDTPEDYDEEKAKQQIANGELPIVPGIDYSKLVAPIIKMVQIQQRQIDELKATNSFYQNIILQMQAEIEQIKQKTEE